MHCIANDASTKTPRRKLDQESVIETSKKEEALPARNGHRWRPIIESFDGCEDKLKSLVVMRRN